MLHRISSYSLFASTKKKTQLLEAFDDGGPTVSTTVSPGLPPCAGSDSPKFVWDKRTASLQTLDALAGSPADTVLLATPRAFGMSLDGSPLASDAGFSLTPGHLKSIQQVRERLFIGNVEAASELAVLQRHGVTHVVNVLGSEFEHFVEHLCYHTIRCSDVAHEPILDHFAPVSDFIAAALGGAPPSPGGGGPGCVFVHCVAGVSRSPTLVAAYLMRAEGLSAADALAAITAARPEARPNASFAAQLLQWEALLASGAVPPLNRGPTTAGKSGSGSVWGGLRGRGRTSSSLSLASKAQQGGSSPPSAPHSPAAPSPLRAQVRGPPSDMAGGLGLDLSGSGRHGGSHPEDSVRSASSVGSIDLSLPRLPVGGGGVGLQLGPPPRLDLSRQPLQGRPTVSVGDTPRPGAADAGTSGASSRTPAGAESSLLAPLAAIAAVVDQVPSTSTDAVGR